MTPQQAAEYARVPLRTIQYALQKGHLKSKQYGRTRLTWKSAVDAWKNNPLLHQPGPKPS